MTNPKNWPRRNRFLIGLIIVVVLSVIMMIYDWNQRTAFPDDKRLLTFFEATVLTGPTGELADAVPFAGPVTIWLPATAGTESGQVTIDQAIVELDRSLKYLAATTGMDFFRVAAEQDAVIRYAFEMDGSGPERRVSRQVSEGVTQGASITIDIARVAVGHDSNCTSPKDGCVGDDAVVETVRRLVLAGLVETLGLQQKPQRGASVLRGDAWPTANDMAALGLLYHPKVLQASGPFDRMARAGEVVETWPDFPRIGKFYAYHGLNER